METNEVWAALGKIGLTPGGTWNADTAYPAFTFVLRNGSSYTSLRASFAEDPETHPEAWQLAAAAGKSIYQLCVDAGTFDGTEEEFVAAYNAAVAAANTAAGTANAAAGTANAAAAAANSAAAAATAAAGSAAAAESATAAAESARVEAERQRVQESERVIEQTEAAKDAANAAAAAANTAKTNADTAAAGANSAAAAATEASAQVVTYNGRLTTLETKTEDLDSRVSDLEAKDLSRHDIYGNLLHKRSTANCYVIRSAGGYMLPLIYGNAIKDGEFNTAAYTSEGRDHQAAFVNHLGNLITGPYIEDHAGCEAKDAVVVWEESQGLITGLKLVEGDTCRELEFKVNTVPATGGNAVVAVRDNNAAIIWSWHIWLYPDNLATEKLTNHTGVEYDVLPVPIGWTWQNANKERGRNVFFQWGRKDPMPSPLNYNGTERSNLSGLITTLTKSATPAASVAEAIKNPHTFFVQDETNHNDWQSAAEFRYNHWDASLNAAGASDAVTVKTVYDPSPVGFKVPGGRLFTGFTTDGGNHGSSAFEYFNVIDVNEDEQITAADFQNGWTFKRNDEDAEGMYLAASGYRSSTSGVLGSVGSTGRYWSAAQYSADSACNLYFGSGNVSPLGNYGRASGFSVLPVRE